MPDPHSTTAGVIAGTGIGLTGTLLGAQVDALLIGLMAAIFVSIWMPTIDNRIKALAADAMSSLLAGYGSPVAAAWLATEQQGFGNGSPLRLLLLFSGTYRVWHFRVMRVSRWATKEQALADIYWGTKSCPMPK